MRMLDALADDTFGIAIAIGCPKLMAKLVIM